MNSQTINCAAKCASAFGTNPQNSTFYADHPKLAARSDGQMLRMWSTDHNSLIEVTVPGDFDNHDTNFFGSTEGIAPTLIKENRIPDTKWEGTDYPRYEHLVSRLKLDPDRRSFSVRRIPLLKAVVKALSQVTAATDPSGVRRFRVVLRRGYISFIRDASAYHKLEEIRVDTETFAPGLPEMSVSMSQLRKILSNLRGREVTISWWKDRDDEDSSVVLKTIQFNAQAKIGGNEIRFVALMMPLS